MKRSAIALLGTWAFVHHQFRTDPLSYLRYPIRASTFAADDFKQRLPRSSRGSIGEVKFSKDKQSIFLQRNPQNVTYNADNLMRWDATTGHRWVAFSEDSNPLDGNAVSNFAVSNDEHRAVMSQHLMSSVQIRDGESGEIRPIFKGKEALIGAPALSTDGTLIAGIQLDEAGKDVKVKVWDTQTGELQQEIASGAHRLAFSPSGDSLAIARGPQLELWDLASKTKRYTTSLIPGSGNNAGDVALALFFSADGKTISVQKGDCQLQQLSAATGESLYFLESRRYGWYYAPENGRSLSSDGKTLACLEAYVPKETPSGTEVSRYDLKLIEVATGTVKQTIEDAGQHLSQIAFSPDDRVLAIATAEDDITLYQLDSGKIVGKSSIKDYGRGIAFSPDKSQLLGINRYGSVALFNPITGEKIRQVVEPSMSSNIGLDPALSSKNRTLMTLGNKSIAIWDNQSTPPKQLHEVPIAYPVGIYRITISQPGDRFATMGPSHYWRDDDYYESTLVIGDIDTGEIVHTLHNNSLIYDAAFSPDGKTIATIHRNNTAHLWDTTTGKEIYQLDLVARHNISKGKKFTSDVGRIGFSADGKTLVTSDDFSIQIWRSQTGKPLHTLKDGTSGISFRGALDLDGDFAISPNGKWLAASKPPSRWNPARDNRIYLWNLQTGRLVRTFVPHTLNPYNTVKLRSLDFSADGKRLVGNDDLNRITIWQLPNRLSLMNRL